ncbi:MAG: EpsG family protein [Clostridia bacterium]
MMVYIVMLVIALLLAYYSQRVENKKVAFILKIGSILPFFLISAFRYDVGTDYLYRYSKDYHVICQGGNITNLEIGFKLLMKLCAFITKEPQILFVITSLLITGILGMVVYRYSKKPVLSIFIFFSGCFFFQSMNLVRQFLAMVIILLSYELLADKKYKAWVICVIMAFLTHSTSIVVVIALLLKKKVVAKPMLIIILSIVILLGSNLLGNALNILLEQTRFAVYINSQYDFGDIRYLTTGVNLVAYLMSYYLYKQMKQKNERANLYMNILALALLCNILGSVTFLFLRISYYFSIIQIIAIPYFIVMASKEANYILIPFTKQNVKQKIEKWLEQLKIKKNYIGEKITISCWNQVILCAIIVIMFSTNVIYYNVLHNDDEVLPYKTIFNKEFEIY